MGPDNRGVVEGADIMYISPTYHARIACRVPFRIVSATRAFVDVVSRQLRLNTGRSTRTSMTNMGGYVR